ncbi:hypothetical protein K9M50_03380 [Patescibacteria group bacterium]|nr:hypothetical protein [Patescibacteria group bacterium]
MTDIEIRKELNQIYQSIDQKDEFEKPVWQGIAELIERSEYGTCDAEVNIKIDALNEDDPFSIDVLNKFDRIQFNALKKCIKLLNDHGYTNLLPYSQGILEGEKCMTLTFTAKN